MRAGDLPDRLVFQARTLTLNAEGQNVETWPYAFTRWGKAQRLNETRCEFFMRHDASITPATHRIVFFDSIWTITDRSLDRPLDEMTIQCDFSAKIEVTTLQATERQFIDGLPTVAIPEE